MKCSECGFENVANARFCSGCGVKLSEAPGKVVTHEIPLLPADLARKIQASAKQLKGSRRNVAVIFADVSGFTAMTETLDPEEVTESMNSVFQKLSDVIFGYEGYIDKFIGDCVMVLFGAPIAHEDDPLRAVLCGIDMLEVMTEFEELELSIGITFGKVVAGGVGSDQKMDYTVMGDTVNLAQRLESAAGNGKIFVSEKIFHETQSEIEYRKLKSIKVKGKKKPVIPFTPVSVKSRYLTRKIKEIPIIGRDSEMNLLEKLFKQVKKNKGQVVSIVGNAGIGKSKLTYEFQLKILKNTKDNIQILEGRCIDYLKGSDYLPLKQILRGLIGASESDSKEEISKTIEKFIKSLKTKSFLQIIPLLKYLFSSEMTEQEKLQVEQLKAEDRDFILNRLIILILKKIAKTKTLIIIFEDIHWSDNASLKFCESLIKELNDSGIFLFLLFRSEFELENFSGLSYYHQISLKSLPKNEGLKLARAILRCEKIDSHLSGLLVSRSEGNPFYIEELASLLLNSDMIKIRKNIAKLKTGELSAIPLKLNELIMAKVDQLNLDLKNILHIASVIGREFSTKILENIVELGAELRTDLDLIEKKELIVRLNREIEQHLREDEYAFKHVIIKDVVYNSILKSERKKQHRFVGETIETLYANNLDDYFDILIHHFRLGKDKKQLLIYLLKSAEKEKKFGHYVKSEKLYEEYLDVIGESIFKTKDGIETCLKFVGFKQIIAKYDDGLKILKDIEDKGKTLLKGELFVKFNLRKIDILTSLGKYEETFKLSKDAEEMLTNITEPGEELKGYCFNCIGNMYSKKGEFDKSLEYFQKSLEIRLKVLSPDYLDVARSYLGLGIVYGNKGELDKAIEYFQKSLDINLKSLGDKHPTVATSYCNIGVIYKMKGEYDKSLKYYYKSLNIKINFLGNDHPVVAASYNNIGDVYRYKGEYDKALKNHNKALDVRLKSLGNEHPDIANCYNSIGTVYFSKGDYDKALKHYYKALNIWLNALGEAHPNLSASYNNIGAIYYRKGDFDKALEYFQKSLKLGLKLLGNEHSYVAGCYNNIGSLYNDNGKYDKALENYQKALDIRLKTLGEEHPTVGRGYINIGLLHWHKGENETALKYFHKSLNTLLKTLGPDHPDVAVCYSSIGGVYVNKGEYSKALEYLKKALDIWVKALGPDHLNISSASHRLAEVYYELKDYEKAMSYIDNAVKISIDKLGNDNIKTGDSEFLLAKILLKLNRIPEAKKHLKIAMKIGKKHKTKWLKDAEELLKKIR